MAYRRHTHSVYAYVVWQDFHFQVPKIDNLIFKLLRLRTAGS